MPGEPHDPADVSTIQRPRFELPDPAPVAFVLDVVDGPDRGARFVVEESAPGPVLVGSSPACAFRLTDREVSRRHASLDIDEQRLRVTDLRSTNGTTVDHTSIVDAWVRSGQVIRVGATSIRATRAGAAGAAPRSRAEGFGRVVGASFEMRRLYPLFEQLAASSLPLIVEGETGTGKELLAESLHELGPRARGPFVVLDCTTIPSAQLEAELFGVDGGRAGLFEEASGGTLFFDEIAELDVQLQPKLLRAIERGEITPVGARRAKRADARVIAGTQADLDHAVQVGRFREDLYHRLVVTRVALPPLRRRRGDVERLAEHFLRDLVGAHAASPLPPLLLSRWLDHGWPGNVRELKNAVTRLVEFGEAGALLATGAADPARPPLDALARVAEFVDDAVRADVPLTRARQELSRVYDRAYVERVLAKHGGNVTRAAAASGVERRYFQVLRAKSKP